MKKDSTKVTMKGNPVTLIGNPVKPGDKAPDFTVVDGTLQPRTLADYRGKVKVMAIYPSIDTGVCAAEGLKNVITLSDHKYVDFGQKYGFLIEELRLLARGTVIIDKDDTVRYVEFVPEVTSEPDFDAASSILKGLTK